MGTNSPKGSAQAMSAGWLQRCLTVWKIAMDETALFVKWISWSTASGLTSTGETCFILWLPLVLCFCWRVYPVVRLNARRHHLRVFYTLKKTACDE
jgi:hypothetical protein